MVVQAQPKHKKVRKDRNRFNVELADLHYELVSEEAPGYGLPISKFASTYALGLSKPKRRVVEKRQTRLNLRLSDLEYAEVLERAEGFGLPLAKFVRVCLVGLPKPAKRIHDLPMINPELYRQIVSIGNNVNQLTRYAHTISLDPKKNLDVLELAFALSRMADELALLRKTYTLDKDLADVFEEESDGDFGFESNTVSNSVSDSAMMVEGR